MPWNRLPVAWQVGERQRLKGTGPLPSPLTPPLPPPNLPCPCPASQQLCFPPSALSWRPEASHPHISLGHQGGSEDSSGAQEPAKGARKSDTLFRKDLPQTKSTNPGTWGCTEAGRRLGAQGRLPLSVLPALGWAGPDSPAQAGTRPLTQLRDPEEDVGEGRGAGH